MVQSISDDIGSGQPKKRTTEALADGWIRRKRLRGKLRQTKLHSEPYDSPRSSRRSTPPVTVLAQDCNENGTNDSDGIECLPFARAHRNRDLSHSNIENKLDEKFSYLFTPPSTVSDYSSNRSSTFDEHSTTGGYSSSPRSDSEGEVYTNKSEDVAGKEPPSKSLSLNSFWNTIIEYPQTIELYPESPQTSWGPSFLPPNQDALVTNDLSLVPNSDLIYEVDDTFNIIRYSGCEGNFDTTNLSSNPDLFDCLDRPISSLSSCNTPPIRYVTEEQATQVVEQIQLRDPLCCLDGEIKKPKIPGNGTPDHLLYCTPVAQGKSDPAATPSSTAVAKVTTIESIAPQASIDIFMKKGSIENWNLGVSERPEHVEEHSPSTSTLMAAAEEDLEERVSHALSGNPALAEILLRKLKARLSFILPLFCEEEEVSPFESSPGCSYFGYERGTTRKRTSGSTPSSASKSTAGTSITTPATSADSGKDCDGDEDEDDELPKSQQRSQKRPRLSGDQERRRLRCHFHAKSPNTHIQKTCIMSGYLNIHNLRGHYEHHHTIIRCNKCFQKFEKKTEKNQHQRTCVVDAPLPILEVIDCDKTDELDEALSIFRTWRLESEDDEEMKNWIIKYKAEFVKNNRPSDDLYDSRELAKWYRMWRVLFPSLETPVPSPFQTRPILLGDTNLERHLEMLQTVVESQIENGQPPPTGWPEQIAYYQEAIRTVYRITAPAPGSSAGWMSEGSHPINGRPNSTSTPADSTGTAARILAIAIDSSPSPGPHQAGRQKNVQAATPRTPVDSRSRAISASTPAAFALPSNLLPVAPHSSADNSGTKGGSPLIMRSGELSNSSGLEATPVLNSPDFPMRPQPPSPVPTQHEAARLTRSATHPGTMLPPPSRSRAGRSFGP
ncbi:hypothetical protein V8E51_001759 [Hyaloscypha variabilis]